jgi:hypothetical protein
MKILDNFVKRNDLGSKTTPARGSIAVDSDKTRHTYLRRRQSAATVCCWAALTMTSLVVFVPQSAGEFPLEHPPICNDHTDYQNQGL